MLIIIPIISSVLSAELSAKTSTKLWIEKLLKPTSEMKNDESMLTSEKIKPTKANSPTKIKINPKTDTINLKTSSQF